MKSYTDNERKVVTKHPSCVDVGECRPPHRASKSTRHWCKGRVGIPHAWEWRRQRSQLEHEQRLGITYHRITEERVCFGCEKIDWPYRSFCGLCGEPWPDLHHELADGSWRTKPCVRCGVAAMIRHRDAGGWKASGSVVS